MDSTSIFDNLRSIVGEKYTLTAPDTFYNYAIDHASNELTAALCVLKPGSVQEVSRIVAFCNQSEISLSIRGGGSGVSGYPSQKRG